MKTKTDLEARVAELEAVMFAKGISGVTRKLGRPRLTERCPCGVMGKQRAQKRGHVCVATLDELYKRKEMQ